MSNYFRPGTRVWISNYPPGYEPGLFDAPRVSRVGEVVMCGHYQSIVKFDDAKAKWETLLTKALNSGEPPK